MNPTDILKERGIAGQAAKLGWVAKPDGYWHYPLFGLNGEIIGARAKKYPSTEGAKYLWPDGKPENPAADWYTPPGTKEAIEAAGGVCFLANGEAALLAFHAAGIKNVVATTHSENTVPKNTEDTLKEFRIATLINIPDKDKAGLNAAVKWRDALLLSDTEYIAKQWPAYLPEKSDFNNLWIHVGFDAQKAQKALNECEALILPQPVVKPVYAKPLEIDYSEGRAKLVSALHEELNRQGKLTRKIYGNFQQCHCPFHTDDNASAGFDIHTGVLSCLGECGKGFSPKALAIKLGIDWESYMPKPEGKKRAKKADFKAFEAALEVIEAERIAETRSYEEIMLEEMAFRVELWEFHKQYVGFGQWAKLPMGILSALMTLCKGRSSTALFVARLHEALVTGVLPTVFTREMAASATRMPYNTVSGALFELEPYSFSSKLSGLLFSIDSIASKEMGKNSEGRPCDWYMVELEATEIQSRLRKMLEVYFREKHTRKALGIPTHHHASQIGLTEAEYRAWDEKAKLALEDPVNKAAKAAYDSEMLGNGGSWRGWYKVLENKWAMPLPYFEYENSLDLRAGILNYWVTCLNRRINSREELARLLGCSDPVIDTVLERAKLKSIPQKLKVELNFNTKEATLKRENEVGEEISETASFQRPTTVKGMESLLNQFMAEHKGKIWKVSFLVHDKEGWQVSDMQQYKRDFAAYNGRISRIFFMLTTPSRQVPMSAFDLRELAEKQAKEASEKAAKQANSSEDKAAEKQASEKAPEKQSYEYAKCWDKHSYAYSYIQLKNFVHSYTMHELKELKIVDKKGKELASGELLDLYQWALANSAAKPTRRMKSLFGQDEDENMAELEAFAAAQLKRLGLSEIVEYQENVEELPIFQEAPVQKSLDFVPVIAKPKALIVQASQGEYDEYLNNPYLGAWEKARREADVQRWLAHEAI